MGFPATLLPLIIGILSLVRTVPSPHLKLLVRGLSPADAVTSPASRLLVFGEGFTPDTKVYFSGLEARHTTFAGPSQLEVITPFLRPGEHPVWVKSGGNRVKASEAFTALPSRVDARLDAALAQAASGYKAAALEALKGIAERDPDYQVRAFAHYQMGRIYYAASDWGRWDFENGEIWLNANLSGPSIQTYWPYVVANANSHYAFNRQDLNDTRLYDMAVAKDVTASPWPLFYRAIVEARIGEALRAQADSRYCLRAEPGNSAFIALAAVCAASAGQKSGATEFARRVRASVDMEIADPRTLTLLGEAEYMIGDAVQARRDWFKAGASDPGRASLSLLLAKKHLWRGDQSVAAMLLSEAIALGPSTRAGEEASRLLPELPHPR